MSDAVRERVVEAGGHRVVCLDDAASDSDSDVVVLYAHMGAEHARAVYALLPPRLRLRPVLAAVTDAVWTRDLSPWPAPALSAHSEAFAGGADAHLAVLTGAVVPAVEALLARAPAHRALVGYSLDGLFALYAATRSDSSSSSPAFDLCASVSGSLWYDGFVDHLARVLAPVPAGGAPPQTLRAAYLSLGSREKRNTRSARMRTVGAATERARTLLAAAGIATVFETNPGSHHDDVPARIARAITWLCDHAGCRSSPAGRSGDH